MADINFVIPHSKNELLSDTDEKYYVNNVIGSKEIHQRLKGSTKIFFISDRSLFFTPLCLKLWHINLSDCVLYLHFVLFKTKHIIYILLKLFANK